MNANTQSKVSDYTYGLERGRLVRAWEMQQIRADEASALLPISQLNLMRMLGVVLAPGQF